MGTGTTAVSILIMGKVPFEKFTDKKPELQELATKRPEFADIEYNLDALIKVILVLIDEIDTLRGAK